MGLQDRLTRQGDGGTVVSLSSGGGRPSPVETMAIDPYASCPCGSGKKFKWCCQDIHADIDRAFQQHNDGQHEAALRTMQQIFHAGRTIVAVLKVDDLWRHAV